MNLDNSISVPLWLLYEDEIEAWRAAQPRARAPMAGRAEFQSRKTPRLAAAGFGGHAGRGGRRAGQASGRDVALARGGHCRTIAGAPIPIGTRILRARKQRNCALGFCLRAHTVLIATGRRRTMPPPSKRRRMRSAICSACGRGAAHGARLDQYAGGRFRSGGTGCCGAPAWPWSSGRIQGVGGR